MEITKQYKFRELKLEGDQGRFEAVFATLNVIDKDGDLTLPGAFGEQQVIVSAYGHGSWGGALPVGKGRIFERGEEAIVDGQFFLDTQAGQQTYLTVKNVGDLQEWSYALPEIDYEMRDENGQRIRVLKRIRVNEVSPVLMGAGVATRLLDIKSAMKPYPNEHSCRLKDPDQYDRFARKSCEQKHDGKCIDVIYGVKEGKSEIQALRYKTDIWEEADAKAHCKSRDGTFEPASKAHYTDSMPLAEHMEALQADAQRLVKRIKDLGELREADDRHPSEATMKRTAAVKTVFADLVRELEGVLTKHDALYAEYLRFHKTVNERRHKDALCKAG